MYQINNTPEPTAHQTRQYTAGWEWSGRRCTHTGRASAPFNQIRDELEMSSFSESVGGVQGRIIRNVGKEMRCKGALCIDGSEESL